METAHINLKVQGKKGLQALQARFDALESEARGRLLKALGAGQHRLGELDVALERMAREDWSVPGLRKRLDALRGRAEALRATAMKRVNEMPATAVAALASSTRVPVKNLARELERLAKLVEPHALERSASPQVEVVPAPEPKPARVPKAKIEV
jgi:hypothetical protein